jgi:formylglycine-generating enzyme required for sulfatase activity
MMGSNPQLDPERDSDEVEHKVCLKDFRIEQYEVTFDEYDRFAAASGKARPSDEGWGRRNMPVTNVNLLDARAYAQWLSKESGTPYRLPTEAEWEYAARGKSSHAYWWGPKPSHDEANYEGKSGRDRWDNSAPVGSFDANPFGLYDMAGNVWEWTCSRYANPYDGSEMKCASEDYSGDIVLRGGSWQSQEKSIRNAYRGRNRPATRGNYYGFRLAATVPDQQ